MTELVNEVMNLMVVAFNYPKTSIILVLVLGYIVAQMPYFIVKVVYNSLKYIIKLVFRLLLKLFGK